MKPNWRVAVGIGLILLLIGAWGVAAVTLADLLGRAPWPVLPLFYLAAGIGWILPLRPLLRWMLSSRG